MDTIRNCVLLCVFLFKSSPIIIQACVFTNDYKFWISLKYISSRHSNLKFSHHFVMQLIKIHTRKRTKEKPYKIIRIFCKIGKAKSRKGELNCVNVSRICAEGIFPSFPWWLEMYFFFKWTPFRMCIPKIKTMTFFRRNLSKLHETAQFCMWYNFFLKQGQARGSSGPITVPIITLVCKISALNSVLYGRRKYHLGLPPVKSWVFLSFNGHSQLLNV